MDIRMYIYLRMRRMDRASTTDGVVTCFSLTGRYSVFLFCLNVSTFCKALKGMNIRRFVCKNNNRVWSVWTL